jgi:hypothetical protein
MFFLWMSNIFETAARLLLWNVCQGFMIAEASESAELSAREEVDIDQLLKDCSQVLEIHLGLLFNYVYWVFS